MTSSSFFSNHSVQKRSNIIPKRLIQNFKIHLKFSISPWKVWIPSADRRMHHTRQFFQGELKLNRKSLDFKGFLSCKHSDLKISGQFKKRKKNEILTLQTLWCYDALSIIDESIKPWQQQSRTTPRQYKSKIPKLFICCYYCYYCCLFINNLNTIRATKLFPKLVCLDEMDGRFYCLESESNIFMINE